MKDFLSDIGYSVQVTSEYDAFMQIKVFQPDIIIVNLIMKDNRGDKLISSIKSIYPNILCLLSSCDSIRLEDFIQNKVDEVIHTPITRSKLSEVLDEASTKFYSRNVGHENINQNKNMNTAVILDEEEDKKSVYKFLFCPYCGEKFTESHNDFQFCPFCGQKLKT